MSSPDPQIPASPWRRLRAGLRRRHAVVAGAAVVGMIAMGLSLGALKRVELPQPDPIDPGDMMRVELVAPVEPDIDPGSIMEVGELVDGYQHRPARPMLAMSRDYESDWSGRDDGSGRDDRDVRSRDRDDWNDDAARLEPPSAPRLIERAGRWFGFETPPPDWRAEREARRARMEATERQRRMEADRRRWEQERLYAEREQAWRDEQARRERVSRDERRPFLREDRRAPVREPVWGDPYGPPMG